VAHLKFYDIEQARHLYMPGFVTSNLFKFKN